ncbi:MAG: VWA domain-containing protein, partial [Anaerolineales bacterium]|nr:VWA domain-containing protein [Anaerolineales bacterium]
MTNNNNGLGNLDALFQSAQDDGLTNNTMDLVVANLNGPTMVTAVNTSLDALASNEVTLAMNIIDMSGSMNAHAGDLIRAYNTDYLEAMRGSTAVDDILVSTILFNDQVDLLHGYVPLPDAPSLTRSIYTPSATTALYDAVAAGLTNMVLYAQQLRSSGVMVRCIVIVYSDGADNASRQRANDVRRAAEELLKHEIYTLAYVGFRSGGMTEQELRRMAGEIGFPDVLMARLSHQELRRIFHMVSMSTVRVSQQGAAA